MKMYIFQEKIIFQSGKLKLQGTLHYLGCDYRQPLVVVVHASHQGSQHFPVYQHLAKLLPPLGIAVFVYDRRGSNGSEGNLLTASFNDLADDALAAVTYLKTRDEVDPQRIGLWGMSQGGWIAPLVAAQSSDISYLILASPPGIDVAEQMDYSTAFSLRENGFTEFEVQKALRISSMVNSYFLGKTDFSALETIIQQVMKEAWIPFSNIPDLDGLPKNSQDSLWYLQLSFDPIPMMQRISIPTLLLYAEIDPWVPIAESIKLWRKQTPAGRQDKLTVIKVEKANHFMLSIPAAGLRGDDGPIAARYEQYLVDWLQKFIL